MESTVKEIRDECDEIVALMLERDFVTPECTAMIYGGSKNDAVHISWNHFGRDYKIFHSATLAVAFAEAREWIMDQPTAEERARQEAIEATAAAKEAWDKVTDRTPQDAAARAQIEAAMKILSENILTKGEGA